MPNGVSTVTSSAESRNSYSPEPPMTPMVASVADPEADAAGTPAALESVTAGQATFESDDDLDARERSAEDRPDPEPDPEEPEEPEPDEPEELDEPEES
jgi:hypothetical protein